MLNARNGMSRIGFWGIAVSATILVGPTHAADELPKFEKVQSGVESYFSKQKDFLPGDLVTRKQVAAVCDEIARLGWKIADRAELEKRALDDGSTLATQLRSASGRKFMRQAGAMSMGYDQLDRLSQLPQGRSTLDRMMRDPQGAKMLEYFASSQQGQEMMKKMSRDANGKFDQPTGKIYTADDLMKALQRSYQRESAKSATAEKR